MLQSRCKVKGFTLIEVMVALAIFATAASMLMLTDGNAVRQTRYIQDKVLAAQVADFYLNKVHASQSSDENRLYNGVRQYAGRTWRIQSSAVQAGRDGFSKITVKVYLGQEEPASDTTPVYQLSTYYRGVAG
ncbi:MAG: type II secretion system minor pseudopilin GspI [Endozoicomonas sp.]|uniref:type II secretion system minor pseudopilin GspI n=1 Tax=Endozoicomonas sp. TaxID=1892382 RepID=UPI003D9BD108